MKKFFNNLNEKYSEYDGRARRKEYWSFMLFKWGVLYFLAMIFSYFEEYKIVTHVVGSMIVLFYIAMFIPTISFTIRRLHDISLSGWFCLLCYIPFINFLGVLVVFILALINGKSGTNKYGENPKEVL